MDKLKANFDANKIDRHQVKYGEHSGNVSGSYLEGEGKMLSNIIAWCRKKRELKRTEKASL